MEKNLDFKALNDREGVTKWVNQYKKLIDLVSIVYDSFKEEYVVFFYWKAKDNLI